MENFLIITLVLLMVGTALFYIRKEKKKGNCIGCPAGGCANCKGCHGAEADASINRKA